MSRNYIHKVYWKKSLALTLALVMGISMLPVRNVCAKEPTGEITESEQQAEKEEKEEIKYEQISISTAEEFAAFAKKCYIDAWSKDKYVSLKADIDLSEAEFEPIPVFNGIFDGGGHTISGFDYVGDGYVVGLFRYIETNGVVQNVKVEGDISSENEKECIGSICGINYGVIQNCTYLGTVSGRDTVGGIAGINESTGTISRCFVNGRITAYYSTGGIAGINHGAVNSCTNQAGINDDSAWVEEDDEMGGIIKTLTASDDNELYSGVDTGGITGFSDGVISNCTNKGTVGYEHTGYNIGGIAGRQSGIVSLSTNEGTVYGRKDIGGIVGQMEPFIEVDEAESLRNAINKLHDIIEKTIDDMDAAEDALKGDMDTMQSYADKAIDTGDDLVGQLSNFVDDNLGEVNTLSERMGHIMDMVPSILDNVSAAGNAMSKLNEIMKQLVEDLDIAGKMEGSDYEETDYSRVALLSTVGGTLSIDTTEPEVNTTVTITASPNDGYQLNQGSLTVVDADGVAVAVTPVSGKENQYTFTMTEKNVKVSAEFVYQGTFLVRSTVGGTVTTSEDGNNVTFKAAPAAGYSFKQYNVKGAKYEGTVNSDNEIVLDKSAYITDHTAVAVEAVFEKKADSQAGSSTTYNVTTASSTGGTVTVDQTSVKAGEKVYATPVAGNGYVLTTILVNGSSEGLQLESDGKRYSFVMPDREVEITAQFEPVDIIMKSNLSGNATYSGNAEGKVTLDVRPDSAYTVQSVTVTDANGNALAVSKKQSGSYLYEFDLATMSKAPCTVNISFEKQNQKDAVDTSKTNIEESIKELNRASGEAQKSMDRIRSIVTKSDGSYKSWEELSSEEQSAVIEEVLNLAEALQDMVSAASSIMSDLSTIYNILSPYTSEAAEAAKKDIEQATEQIDNILNALKAANNGVKGIVNYVNGQPDIKFAKLGDGFDSTKETFHNQLKGLSESIKSLSNNAGNYSDIINEDLRQVNDQLNVVFNLLADRMVDVEQLSIEELYEEVDDEDIDSITTGRADACTNKGVVKGDINVGGIAGSMAIDDEDPEDSAAGSIEYEIGRRFITKCLVTNSVNEGYITAKKDGAGGICGYMNHGIIIDSEGYGSVESTEGDFVGGICGESLTIIKRCYTLCSVSGNQNVGGIAGYADTLQNCYAMADVKAENGRVGAIAGQIASYEEVDVESTEEPKITGNYYVGENTYGIDNISYIGVAEPISYNELLTVEQLPTPFWHLKVIYKIEDTCLGSEEIRYGTKLDHLNYPKIPEKVGFYGVWPDLSDKKMQGTVVVEAEYRDNVTVVQSSNGELEEDEAARQKPYALVENIFTEDTILHAVISDRTPPAEAKGKDYVLYEVTLENSGIGEEDTFALRLLNPYSDATVYGCQNDTWTELESKTRGQYLQVDMQGTTEIFCIVENKSGSFWMIPVGAAVVGILLIVILKKKKGHNQKNQQNC